MRHLLTHRRSMAVLKDTFAHHFEVVAILAGLFVFVVLVTPSPPVQGSLRPPSVCVAPYVYYERIGMIQPYLLFSILVSGLLTSSLKRRTAAADAPPPTLWIRAYGMLALLLSFVSILLLAVLASYMAQVRFGHNSGSKTDPMDRDDLVKEENFDSGNDALDDEELALLIAINPLTDIMI
uniref:Uncharacterized protein n=1 Tax=Aegilops tauschii TaxID=37682 RepID=M8CVY5_AEGTA